MWSWKYGMLFVKENYVNIGDNTQYINCTNDDYHETISFSK